MNERIRELAEHCWINDGGPDSYFSQQKFAELIVRECANVIHTRIGPKSALDVLEHFGVES